MRTISHHYEDALDRVWLTTAERIGLRVVRSNDVYASTDGRGTLIIGSDETLDADDSLSQMIFHELCHSLVEGRESLSREDWGLFNHDDRDMSREHACLRLQAALTTPLGLRHFFAPTTDHRAFFDALDDDPLWPHDDMTCVLARKALLLADKDPWGPHVRDALEATAAIAQIIHAFSNRHAPAAQSLWANIDPKLALHASGFPIAVGTKSHEQCGTCAWLEVDARGQTRCKQAGRARVGASDDACERWEATLDCQRCGACCREAYDTVDVAKRDAFVKKQPSLIVIRGDKSLGIARSGSQCAALEGGHAPEELYACRVYEDRPRTCRDFTLGSNNCLDARRRLGLSR